MNGQHNAKSKLSAKTGSLAVRLDSFRGRGIGVVASQARLRGVAALVSLLGLLLVLPSGAAAKQIRLFSGAFGAATSTPSNPYPLSKGAFGPSSVAVDDATGDVYVTDQGNRRIEKFTATGEFILMFGKEVNRTKVTEAAPVAQQNVCTAASGDTCQAGARASSPGAFDPTNAIEDIFEGEIGYLLVTVDNSSGPSKGDVYVADSGDGLITKFDSSDEVVESWGNNGPGGSANGQLNGSAATGPIPGFYPIFEGIATDSAGNLWVASGDNTFATGFEGELAEFSQDSSFIKDWNADTGNEIIIEDTRAGIALDSLDDVFGLPNEYGTDGNWIGTIVRYIGPDGIAIDSSSNELYVLGNEFGEPLAIQRFDASCKPHGNGAICKSVESFGVGHLSESAFEEAHGLAVNPTGGDTIYASELSGEVTAFAVETVPDVLTAKASGFTSSSATLNGTVNPSGVGLSECFFEWGQTREPYEHKVPCEPSTAAVGSGSSPVPVHASVSGLQSGKTYHFRLVAANANDVNSLIDEPSLGEDQVFGPPQLESSGAAAVSATAVILQAKASPNGAETSLRFEYGTETGVYNHVTTTVDLGSGSAFQSVSRAIEGLEPLTTYHYRVVVENTFGTVEGEDHSFRTQGSVFPGLPDGRAWELVSPPEKNGIPLEAIAIEGGDIQAAADGSDLAYIAKGAIGSEPAGDRSFAYSQLLARRGLGGWSTQDITPPNQAPAGFKPSELNEYMLFSSDLSLAALQPAGATPLSLEATEYTPYLHQSDGAFTPLVYPGNVPSGTKFGGNEINPEEFGSGVRFDTATPDLSHLILSSPSVLTEPSFASGGGNESLYEWAGGSLSLVSQIPTAPAIVCGGAGPACSAAASKGLTSDVGAQDGHQMRNAISDDGNRVIFTSGGSLFLRDTVRGETVRLDVPQEGAAGGGGEPLFQDASTDGSYVFFTDAVRLTVDSTAQGSQPDLYMCKIGEQDGHLACALTDISIDHNSGEAADVQGLIPGSDEAGKYVYFVATGRLTPGAASGVNLYVYDTETATTKLVAKLSEQDSSDWAKQESSSLKGLAAAVSTSGRYLAFMSERSLTGYDNRDARDGQPDQEVYLYDAFADGGNGKLVCASCNSSGARPDGIFDPGGSPGLLVDRNQIWQGEQLAASIPGWTNNSVGNAIYQSRYLSNSGRLFFDAADALVPQDSNGFEDVYQYEPSGVGGCSESSPTFGNASGGCVGLISSGTSSEESAFLDASESGNDVFFLTSAKLAPADVDSVLDVYDAHVCGGESTCPSVPPSPSPACEGDSCQSPVVAPEDPTPDSLTFQGPGDITFAVSPVAASKAKAKPLTRAQKLARALKACGKKPKRKRAACERQARRAYSPASRAKKSNGRDK